MSEHISDTGPPNTHMNSAFRLKHITQQYMDLPGMVSPLRRQVRQDGFHPRVFLDPNTYQLHTLYKTGAHRTDPTRIQQGPRTAAHRKTLRTIASMPSLYPPSNTPKPTLCINSETRTLNLCVYIYIYTNK